MGNVQLHGTRVKVDQNLIKSAPITEEALSFIKEHTAGSTVLEIGCGSGIYADLLRKRGVQVIATDACRINKEGLLPSSHENRMAKFTNKRAINNMIEKNAVEAVQNHGQNTSLSLFLSFPLPHVCFDDSPKYDELALRDFKGNKFFLIAMYERNPKLEETKNYRYRAANDSTGSGGFHIHLYKYWNLKDTLLLETGRLGEGTGCYLLYFERKKPATNMSGGTNRKCPKNNAKDFKLKTVKKGLDGKLWKVEKRSDGVKYWKRFS